MFWSRKFHESFLHCNWMNFQIKDTSSALWSGVHQLITELKQLLFPRGKERFCNSQTGKKKQVNGDQERELNNTGQWNRCYEIQATQHQGVVCNMSERSLEVKQRMFHCIKQERLSWTKEWNQHCIHPKFIFCTWFKWDVIRGKEKSRQRTTQRIINCPKGLKG